MNNDSTIPSQLGPVDTMPSQLGPAEASRPSRRPPSGSSLSRIAWLLALAGGAYLATQLFFQG